MAGKKFLSTPSARRATRVPKSHSREKWISIHALREEGDLWSETAWQSSRRFLSTPSARRATRPAGRYCPGIEDFYPRPPRGGRPAGLGFQQLLRDISIHALREEGDPHPADPGLQIDISIHALREEGDFLPLRERHGQDISIHALREEGDNSFIFTSSSKPISIHALREEGDVCQPFLHTRDKVFLSTPSARRATVCRTRLLAYKIISIHALREEGDIDLRQPDIAVPISIHALREEGDRFPIFVIFGVPNFYPRPPRGGRPSTAGCMSPTAGFLSTPSARRATVDRASLPVQREISIHALREEGDLQGKHLYQLRTQFLSTPSARRATSRLYMIFAGLQYFYPRPPRGGRL